MSRAFYSMSFLLYLLIVPFTQGVRLVLYENADHQGLVFEGEINENCTNLVSTNDTVSSVNTSGACVYLYEHHECLGRRLKLDPGIHSHNDLRKHNFNDKTSSFKKCSDPDHFIYGRLGLYDHVNHEALFYEGDIVERCTTVPDKVNDRTSSVNTDDTCVLLYEHANCKGRRLKLQPGIHSHNDLTMHSFNDKISSFQACGETADDPVYGRLRLYELAEHKGLIYEGDITDNCTNLSPGSDVNASSVNSDGVCVDLYDQMNCTGQRLKLQPTDHSHNDLTTHEFDNTISSYTSCKELPIRSNIMPSMPSTYEASIVTLTQANQSYFWILMGMGILATFIVLFAVGLIILYRKYLRVDTALRKLTPEEVQEFLQGKRVERHSGLDGAELAVSVPFTKTIAAEAVQVTSTVLGSGHYGTVYKGYFGSFPVAVKTFKRSMDVEDFKAILVEAKIMAYVGGHPNVIHFWGAEVIGIMDRKITLVSEFCPRGDLLAYLRLLSSTCQYANVEDKSKPIEAMMALWCQQIASAMEYLEDKRVVHGDLAARNVLVFTHELVKITDFGLSKQLYASSEYLLKRKRELPWRWCSCETLTRLEFSTDSDIWAFGVTAWEIFSMGRIPWERQLTCQSLIRYLEQGGRMARPDYANDETHKVMLDCWKVERTARPRFSTLRDFFHLKGMS